MRHRWLLLLGMLLPALAVARPSEDLIKKQFGEKARVGFHSSSERIRMITGMNLFLAGENPVQRSLGFVQQHAPMLKIDPKTLLADEPVVARNNVRVRMQQTHEGLTVFGSDIVIRLDASGTHIRTFTNNVADLSSLSPVTEDVGEEFAIQTARSRVPGATDGPCLASRGILASTKAVHVYRVVVPTVNPIHRKVVFVDVQTGTVLWVRSAGIE